MDLFVSTKCPQCGAEISFEEESTVVYCQYCGSALCLTGRSGVTRTYVPPRKDVVRIKKALKEAVAETESAKALISEQRLFFAPYWRVKGMVFRWVFGTNTRDERIKELKTKHLDQTFPAHGGVNLGLHSLGIRPEALKLFFFDREEMTKQGTVLDVVVPFEAAVTHSRTMTQVGLDEKALFIHFDRTWLVGERYSIVYFPFWMIRVSLGDTSRVLILDGVANTVTRTLSVEAWAQMVNEAKKAQAPVSFSKVSFMAFKCPNCGWDLPLNRFNIIHLCHTCHQAWMERDGRFRAVAYEVVTPAQTQDRPPDQPVAYLPFWSFRTEISNDTEALRTVEDLHAFSGKFPTRAPGETDRNPIRLYLPAAEIRNIAAVNKLATDVTIHQPALNFMSKDELTDCTLLGACLSPQAAREMADILLCSLTPKENRKRQEFLRGARISTGKMRLFWWPFSEQRLFLRDAVCGCGIQKGTVSSCREAGLVQQ